jgi:hypothetical protein
MAFPPSLFAESGQQFCNADSFAMAFDDVLHIQARRAEFQALKRSEALELILSQVAHHPFAQMDMARAREVGEFRLRLHGV